MKKKIFILMLIVMLLVNTVIVYGVENTLYEVKQTAYWNANIRSNYVVYYSAQYSCYLIATSSNPIVVDSDGNTNLDSNLYMMRIDYYNGNLTANGFTNGGYGTNIFNYFLTTFNASKIDSNCTVTYEESGNPALNEDGTIRNDEPILSPAVEALGTENGIQVNYSDFDQYDYIEYKFFPTWRWTEMEEEGEELWLFGNQSTYSQIFRIDNPTSGTFSVDSSNYPTYTNGSYYHCMVTGYYNETPLDPTLDNYLSNRAKSTSVQNTLFEIDTGDYSYITVKSLSYEGAVYYKIETLDKASKWFAYKSTPYDFEANEIHKIYYNQFQNYELLKDSSQYRLVVMNVNNEEIFEKVFWYGDLDTETDINHSDDIYDAIQSIGELNAEEFDLSGSITKVSNILGSVWDVMNLFKVVFSIFPEPIPSLMSITFWIGMIMFFIKLVRG